MRRANQGVGAVDPLNRGQCGQPYLPTALWRFWQEGRL